MSLTRRSGNTCKLHSFSAQRIELASKLTAELRPGPNEDGPISTKADSMVVKRFEPLRKDDQAAMSIVSRSTRVLAVGSDLDLLSDIEAMAEDGNLLRVDTSVNIAEAVARLERRPFDAVLLELPAPEPEAFHALRCIREAAPQVALVVVAASPEMALSAMEQTADDYLVKSNFFDETLCMRVLRHAIERKAWERELYDCLQMNVHVYEKLGIGLFDLERDGSLAAANEAFCRMLGVRQHALAADLGRYVSRGRQHFKDWFDAIEKARGVFKGQLAFKSAEGSERIGLTYVTACHDSLGRKMGYRGAVMDITELAQRADELTYEASHDPETKLYNGRMLERLLKRRLEQVPDESPVAVCQFRVPVAECERLYGGTFKRQFVRCLGAVLKHGLNREDILGRFDDETFCVIFRAETAAEATESASRVVERIRLFRFDCGGESFNVDVTAGMAFVSEAGYHPKAVLAAADDGCEIARAEGRPVSVVPPASQVSRRVIEARRWAARIKTLSVKNALQLHYQSIVPLRRTKAETPRFDVLVRYGGLEGKLHMPAAFMRAARQYNLGATLDISVVDALFRSEAYGRRTRFAPWFTVRLSAGTVGNPRFVERLRNLLENAPSPYRRLCFSIPFEAVYENTLSARSFAGTLRMLGCDLMLEQFGEPVSITTLRELKPAYVRLTPSVIKGIETNKMRRETVRALVGLAGATGAKVIACNVECTAALPVLERCGVHYAQGFGLAEPGLRATEP